MILPERSLPGEGRQITMPVLSIPIASASSVYEYTREKD